MEKKINKKKISFSLLQDKIQHLTWHSMVAPFIFLSFTIVSFPLGFYIYLHSSSLCYSPSLHFSSSSSSETSNLNLFSLCFSPPLLSVFTNHDNSEKLLWTVCPLFSELFCLNIHHFVFPTKKPSIIQPLSMEGFVDFRTVDHFIVNYI